jgi:hypothetical protein
MIARAALLGLALLFAAPARAEPPHLAEAGPEAVALKKRLLDAHFVCKMSPTAIATCMSPLTGDPIQYPEPVAIIIPPRFRPGGRLILHLHGWLEDKPFDRTPQAILNFFDFPALLHQSGVLEDLFVLPFSQGRCQTYKDRIAKSFEAFFGSLFSLLNEPAPARITLSGHSGAWTPIETILEEAYKGDALDHVFGSRIDAVFLFDATYSGDLPVVGGANPFMDETIGFKHLSQAWSTHPNPRVSAVYRKGTYTELGAKRLSRELGSFFRKVGLSGNSDHWRTVQSGFPGFLRELKD